MKHHILSFLAALALIALGFAVGEVPGEVCNADYCIQVGQTIEQLGL